MQVNQHGCFWSGSGLATYKGRVETGWFEQGREGEILEGECESSGGAVREV